jgi:hypothetical protein
MISQVSECDSFHKLLAWPGLTIDKPGEHMEKIVIVTAFTNFWGGGK